jgi:hexosaminidase
MEKGMVTIMDRISVIPKINDITVQNGRCVLTEEWSLRIPEECSRAGSLLKKLTGLKETTINPGKQVINLQWSDEVIENEGYFLRILEDAIDICAKTEQGLFYGVQTLRQILPEQIEETGVNRRIEIDCMVIKDSPRFPYRGFMLDEARHFFGADAVKALIDQLAGLKINKFHWHLTDHQGWRIEIKQYPRLTEIGSKRSKTQKNGMMALKAVYVNEKVSGFYTQEQIKEIVAYAAEHFIDIIPEIDLPGHSYAALAAYPQFSCDGKPVEVAADYGLASFLSLDKLLCAGKEETYTFVQEILDEIMELFPPGMIHLGSDEAPKKVWKKCPHCQSLIKAQNLKDVKELQGYMINRLAGHLMDKGYQVICWNDGLYDNADDRIIIQHWLHDYQKTINHVKAGRKAIVSTLKAYYLDYPYINTPLQATYEYEPILPELSDAEVGNILGIEAPLWTEFVKNRARMEWQLYPRLLAVSETGWTQKPRKDYSDFERRAAVMEARLESTKVNYAPLRFCHKFDKRKSNGLKKMSYSNNLSKEYEEYHH